MLLSIFLGVFLEYSTFDFSEKHTTGIYIWLSVSIRVQIASLPTWQGNCIYLKREISSHKSVPDLQIIEREVCFWQRGRTRISVDGDIEKGNNSDTDDSAQILRIFLWKGYWVALSLSFRRISIRRNSVHMFMNIIAWGPQVSEKALRVWK